MQAGKLRHRIALQRADSVQDPQTGEIVKHWRTVDNVWAEVVPLSAREYLAARATQSETEARVVIRYRADVDSRMRLIHRGEVYVIDGVLADKSSGIQYLTLLVSKGVQDD